MRTMHSRLRLARDRGLFDSPGSSTRLGVESIDYAGLTRMEQIH